MVVSSTTTLFQIRRKRNNTGTYYIKLLFITLPRVFQQMPFGRLFAFFFFISVLFAGITSLANMLEAVSEAAQTRLKLS